MPTLRMISLNAI